jgi:glycosyltransferase 2 family protein
VQEAQHLTDSAEPTFADNRRRAAIGLLLVLVAVALAGLAIYRQRHPFAHALDRIGTPALIASLAAGLVATAANFPVWHIILRGLDVDVPLRVGVRVFFVSQLGKYLPGAIWPVVLQMEAVRRRRASRRAVVSGNVITIVLGCSVGLIVACALLPFGAADILGRYWWLLIAVPLLLPVLHPSVAPRVINRLLALARRPAIDVRLDGRTTALAASWSAISWLALGAHVALLAIAVGGGGFRTVLLCTGGAALAVADGILVVPVPAGVGIRDSILGLVLAVQLTAAEAIAVVVVSRVMLIVVDLVLAAAAAAYHPRAEARSPDAR